MKIKVSGMSHKTKWWWTKEIAAKVQEKKSQNKWQKVKTEETKKEYLEELWQKLLANTKN